MIKGVVGLFLGKNLSVPLLLSLILMEDSLILRFSFINILYLSIRLLLKKLFPNTLTLPLKMVGLGAACLSGFIIEDSVLIIYSRIIFIFGNIYKIFEFLQIVSMAFKWSRLTKAKMQEINLKDPYGVIYKYFLFLNHFKEQNFWSQPVIIMLQSFFEFIELPNGSSN